MFEHPAEKKSRVKRAKRNAALIAAFAILSVIGIFSLTTGDGNLINTAAVLPSGEQSSNSFDVSGTFSVPSLELDVDDITLVVTVAGGGSVTINGLDVDNVQGPVVINGLSGEIKVEQGHIAFEGKADSVSVDELAISGKVVLSSEGLFFDQVEIANFDDTLSMTTSGTLATDRGTFIAENELIEVRPFTGSLNIGTELVLKGTTSKVTIYSNPKVLIE